MSSFQCVTNASFERATSTRPTSTTATATRCLRQRARRAALGGVVLLMAACGGGDDETGASSDSSTSTTGGVVVTTIPAPLVTTTTTPATTTSAPVAVTYVTEGATVIVANASDVNGAAGRLTDRLKAVGFTTGSAVNSTEGTLAVTKIYYDAANTSAKAVADSLALALGGGEITVVEVGVPPPIDTADLAGAGVLIAMGNDVADKSLEQLQGLVAAPTASSTADESSTATSSGSATSTAG